MDWLAKIIFPNTSINMRRRELHTLLLVVAVTLIFCTAMAIVIYAANSKHH